MGTQQQNNPYQPHMEEPQQQPQKQQNQTRQKKRQERNRLAQARKAERSLASLTTVFGKMSGLIQAQGEVIERIEDDVQLASGMVDDGVTEINKVYEMTRGNRSLIVKVFGILLFFVVFVKF